MTVVQKQAIILWKKVSLYQHVLEILPEMLSILHKGTNFVLPCQENTSVHLLGASHFLESKIKDTILTYTHKLKRDKKVHLS